MTRSLADPGYALIEGLDGRRSDLYAKARERYVEAQQDRLAGFAGGLHRTHPDVFEELMRAVTGATAQDLERVIIAPRVTQRLRTCASPSEAATLAQDIAEHLATEEAVRSRRGLGESTWTALGDAELGPDGSVRRPVVVDGLYSVDVASPQALSMDAQSSLCGQECRPPLTRTDILAIQRRLEEAMDLLSAAAPPFAALVSTCALNTVVVRDAGLNFSSSTHGLYIGRVVLGAGDWTSTTVAQVADALVHEAIHCFLLMVDSKEPLLRDDLAADRLDPVPSPWTGNPLPVPTYVHALMVWYALLTLWTQIGQSDALPAAVGARMLERARRGFVGADPVARLGPEAQALLNTSTIDCLEALRELLPL